MMRHALLLALLISGHAQAQTLLWSEEFDADGAPNPSTWTHDLGATGWGNQELQNYTDDPANASVANGQLNITVRREGTQFTSARIKTEGKVEFRYGTVEAKIRVPDLQDGLWPAFWTLGSNFSTIGWPQCGELDIFEMGSSDAINQGVVNRRVGSTAHWENNNARASYGLTLDAATDLNDDFHLFRMEWTPSAVTTFLDGQQIWQIDITPSSCTDCTEFHQPHFMLLNVAVGGTYTGRFNAAAITAATPATMEVDYIRLFDNGFTELTGTGIDTGPPDLGPGHSGSWYNVDQSGHGFSMEFGETAEGPLAVIYWYTYDADGSPLFFVGTGVPEGTGVDIEFLSPVGMRFGEFDPDSVVREPAGTARFEFSDRDNGTFSYSPSAFSSDTWGHQPIDDLPLVRLFAVPVDSSRRR